MRGVEVGNLTSTVFKIKQESKDLIDALKAVKTLDSNRDFVEKALEALEKEMPEAFEKARNYLRLIEKGDK